MSQTRLDPFQALADPSRREILRMLSKEKRSINSIAENFNISRTAVSKHVKILYENGFIEIEELGRERYCQLSQEGFNEIQEWINFFEKYWTKKMKNLEIYLNMKHK